MGTVLQRGAAEYPNLQAVSMHGKWFAALQRAQTKINVEANKHPSITVGLCVWPRPLLWEQGLTPPTGFCCPQLWGASARHTPATCC